MLLSGVKDVHAAEVRVGRRRRGRRRRLNVEERVCDMVVVNVLCLFLLGCVL